MQLELSFLSLIVTMSQSVATAYCKANMGLFDYLERRSKTQNENAEGAGDKPEKLVLFAADYDEMVGDDDIIDSSSRDDEDDLIHSAKSSAPDAPEPPDASDVAESADNPDELVLFAANTMTVIDAAESETETEEAAKVAVEPNEQPVEESSDENAVAPKAAEAAEAVTGVEGEMSAVAPATAEGATAAEVVEDADEVEAAAAVETAEEVEPVEGIDVLVAADFGEAAQAKDAADAAQAVEAVGSEELSDVSADEANETDKPNEADETKQSKKDKKRERKAKKNAAKHGKHAAGVYNPPSVADGEAIEAASGFAAIPSKKKHPVLKGMGIAACVVVVLAAVIYGAGVLVFSNRILPNTFIGNQDISLKSNEEVVQLLDTMTANYSVEAKCGSFSFRTTQADLGLSVGIENVISNIHGKYDPLKWPLYVFEPVHDVSDALDIQFDPTSYAEAFTAAIDSFNQSATAPTNAYIYYDEKAKKFLVQDEVGGTQLDPVLSLAVLTEGIRNLQPVVRFTEDEIIQPTVRGNDERLVESARLATGLISSHIALTIDGKNVRELSSAELSQGIAIDENFQVTFNDEHLNGLCDAIAESFNTIGSERTYTRADGKVITVSGGDAGWEVNTDELKAALLDAIKRAEAASIEVPFYQRGSAYVERGQRDWGNRYIDVDLSEQHVRFYDENGNLFWETDCITGTPDGAHNTPQGVWSVNDEMRSPSKLVGYENGKKIYETTVTFWMPFIRNSIGFHDATWQPGFGGSMYANGYGSHGCVNISYSAARELYNMIQVDDVVVTHY